MSDARRTARRLAPLLAALLAAAPQAGAQTTADPPATGEPRRSLTDELYQTLGEHGLEATLRRHDEIRQSSPERYDLAEPQLNRLGYRLLGDGRIDEAIAFFRLNTELFPDSANARDSLAEAYLWADRPADAAAEYEAALAVLARHPSPASPAAQNLERRARGALAAYATATAGAIAPAAPSAAAAAEEPHSPRLRRLAGEVATVGEAALQAFLGEIRASGAPLVEALPESRGEGRFLVTFLWLAAADDPGAIVVESPFEGRYVERRVMERLAGTRLWFKSFEAPAALRAGYLLSPADRRFGPYAAMYDDAMVEASWRLDPWNPRHERGEGNRDWSVLALPAAGGAPWLRDEPVPPETLQTLALPDADLGEERKVVVYSPAGGGAPRAGRPLVIFLDGYAMFEIERSERMLGRMAREGTLPPVVAAFVYSPGSRRNLEHSCHEPMQRFLAEELLPVLRERFGAGRSAEQTVIVGRSRSGLGAVCAAFARPDAIGKALAQSGSFWWAPEGEETEWLARQVADAERRPIAVSLQAGSLEGSPNPSTGLSMLTVSRHLRDVMRAKGYPLHYREYGGGHDPTAWRATLPGALVELLAPPR